MKKANILRRQERAFAWAFLFLFTFSMVGGQSIALPTLAGSPEGFINIVVINGDEYPFNFSCPDNPLTNPVTIAGGGNGYAPSHIEQYAVQVDWEAQTQEEEAGSIDNGLGIFFPSSGKGFFSFTYDAGPHTYTTNGTHTIKARLYHLQPPGNDGQADATAEIEICVQVEPQAEANIEVTKSVDDSTPDENQNITYTITAANNGPDAATGVTVADILPAGVTYISNSPSQETYDSGTRVWTVGDLANGASATLDITATVDAATGGSTITNTASSDPKQT